VEHSFLVLSSTLTGHQRQYIIQSPGNVTVTNGRDDDEKYLCNAVTATDTVRIGGANSPAIPWI